MHILVTGGAGYIGSNTAFKLLQQGHQVTILDHLEKDKGDTLAVLREKGGNYDLIKADLRDPLQLQTELSGKNFDAMIHFAAFIEVGASTKEPLKYIDNNVVGSQNLFRVMAEIGCKNIVFSSSAAVYGTPEKLPLTEDSPKKPDSPYGMSKLIVEKMLETYGKFGVFNAISLRYFNPSGSNNGLLGERHLPETHFIPRILRSLINPEYKFSIFGQDYPTPDGTAVRDYIHIVDLVDAHIKCLEFLQSHKGHEAFNVGTGKGSSVKEVINTIEKITGKKAVYELGPRRDGDSAVLVADPSHIKDVMGWEASYNLEDIITSAWEWEQKRPAKDYA